MTDNPLLEQDYVGFKIGIEGFKKIEGLRARVDIWFPGQDTLNDDPVSFIEELPRTVRRRSRDWPDDDVEAMKRVMERGLHRVRGAILLERVQELAGATFTIPAADQSAQRSDEYLRRLILGAFKRELERNPSGGDRLEFDDSGVALVENVDPARVEYVLKRLEIGGHLKPWTSPSEPGHRPYIITQQGLAEADRLAIPARAPGLLLEETVARVENTLNKHKPELTESLRMQSLRIAEAREMGEHEVGEVAQACEQIIWDFLDLDILWNGVEGERPEKQKTRDRIRILVRAKAPSETEQDLLDALGQYVPEWFGRLEQFIHKYRHVPGESERSHAKRFVVYTYMLLGDLIELFGP